MGSGPRTDHPAPYAHWLRSIGLGAAFVAATTGVLVLVGWWLDVAMLKSVLPEFATMKVNTAVAFIAAGASVALQAVMSGGAASSGRRQTARGTALVVAFIGAITVVEYASGLDLGVDELLAVDGDRTSPFPGRMAPATAVGFLLLGAALLTINHRDASGKRPMHWLILPVACNGYLATLGYLYDVQVLYGVGPYTSVALHTAILFLVLSVGFVCVAPGNALAQLLIADGAGSFLARRLVPAAVFIPPAFGWVRLVGERAGYYGLPFGLALFATSNVVVFSMLIWHTARAVQRADQARALALAEVEAANAALALSNRELQQFAYVASHDLVAPLRSVHGFLELLEGGYATRLDDQARDWIRRSIDGAKRMHVLIQDVLAYARLDGRHMRFERVALKQVWDKARQDHELPIAELRGTLTADPLPIVRGDPSLLLQLLRNLLANALKYRGTAAPQVHVSARRTGNEWLCSVRDNGIGIAAEHHEDIFALFRRLHDRQQYPGTGIGLAVCRGIVERHGGRIWVESTPGLGSTFVFTLQAAEDATS